ncbi:MAG TPA: hypothetical protein DHV64_11450, partial [Erythrobacter sp.]|nr:hypothetical protein [Erythrobacter sp.]
MRAIARSIRSRAFVIRCEVMTRTKYQDCCAKAKVCPALLISGMRRLRAVHRGRGGLTSRLRSAKASRASNRPSFRRINPMSLATARMVQMANAIRALSMDAVQAANSGHPGMPMGMADV